MSVEGYKQSGWKVTSPEANFTVTLFLFAWSLLPIGFMSIMLVFHKFEDFRLPIMALSEALLLSAFVSGLSQRKGSIYDVNMQLSGVLISISVVFLAILYLGELEHWWWIGYAFCIGSVPYLFVSLSAMAGWSHPAYQIPWEAKAMVPIDECLTDWNIVTARWSSGIMAWKKLQRATAIMYGGKNEDELHLNVEILASQSQEFSDEELGIHWSRFGVENQAENSEE